MLSDASQVKRGDFRTETPSDSVLQIAGAIIPRRQDGFTLCAVIRRDRTAPAALMTTKCVGGGARSWRTRTH